MLQSHNFALQNVWGQVMAGQRLLCTFANLTPSAHDGAPSDKVSNSVFVTEEHGAAL